MNKQDIIQSVIDYLQNDKAKYAIMLSGTWGSGKTHLYKNVLAGEIRNIEYGKNKERRKSETYISLYGMSSVEELTKEIMVNYILKCKMNENPTGEKVFKGVSKVVGIASKMISFSVNNFSFDLGSLPEILQEDVDFESMVICFDDLERCSIPINDIFGVINNLVEHCNCKVIIIADENNIGKMYANTNIEDKYLSILNGRKIIKEAKQDKSNSRTNTQEQPVFEEITIEDLKQLNEDLYAENFLYKDIKEKVIGLSLRYDLDLREEYDAIVEDSISGEQLKEFLTANKDKILDYMDKCNNRNIRIMKNWLINFERIYLIVQKYYHNEEKYIDKVIEKFLIYSIRMACAAGKNKRLVKWKNGEKISVSVRTNDGFIFNSDGYRFIDILFETATLKNEDVCHAARFIINNLKEEEKRNEKYYSGECLNKLNSWRYCEDYEILEIIEGLIQEIKDKKYVYQHYQKIISILVFLQGKGLYDGDIKDVVQIMIDNIENEEEIINVENMNIGLEDPNSISKYKEYYNPIDLLIKKKNREKTEDKFSKALVNNSENWASSFEEYCRDNSDSFYDNYAFIQYIDIDNLLAKLKDSRTEEVYPIVDGFKYIYRFGNINEYFKGDIPHLEEFIKQLEETEWNGKTKKIAIDIFVDVLKEKVKDIDRIIYK